MIQHYAIILLGSAIGMFLTVLVQSEIINRSQKFEAGFKDAFKFYTTKHRGGLYVGGTVIFLFMFLLPNLITSNIKMLDSILANLRLWSVGIGVASTAIGFLLVKGTHKKLDEFAEKNNIK